VHGDTKVKICDSCRGEPEARATLFCWPRISQVLSVGPVRIHVHCYPQGFVGSHCYGHISPSARSSCTPETKPVRRHPQIGKESLQFNSTNEAEASFYQGIPLSSACDYARAVGIRPVLFQARVLQDAADFGVSILHFSLDLALFLVARVHEESQGLLVLSGCGKLFHIGSCFPGVDACLMVWKSNGCVMQSHGSNLHTCCVQWLSQDDIPAPVQASIASFSPAYQTSGRRASRSTHSHSHELHTATSAGSRVCAPSYVTSHYECASKEESAMHATPTTLKLTPSSIREFEACPYRFEQLYLLPAGQQGGPGREAAQKRTTPVMQFSSNLHAALEELHRPVAGSGQRAGRDGSHTQLVRPADLTEDEIRALLSRHWRGDAYADPQQEAAALEQGVTLLSNYCRSPHANTSEVLACEAFLSTTTVIKGYRVQLSARVDRLDLCAGEDGEDGAAVEALDFKFSTRPAPTPEEMRRHLPTFLGWLLTWQRYRGDSRIRKVRVGEIHLLTSTKVVIAYDERDLIENKARLTALVEAAMNGPLQPRVSAACTWCPLRESCPAHAEHANLDLDDLDHYDEWQRRAR
jgi:PD-(D/E)XK nuclease superfamily